MPRITSALFFFLLAAFTLMPPSNAKAAQFTVFFSNDVHGEIEPCG